MNYKKCLTGRVKNEYEKSEKTKLQAIYIKVSG